MDSLEIYSRLPVWLQNAACSWYGLREAKVRFGREFDRRLERLKATEWWSADEFADYQDQQVTALVRHAYENVPYYHELMMSLRLSPSDFRGVADLVKLPVLTKEDVRANLERLVAQTSNRRALIKRHTSGTTGKSLDFYSSASSIAFQWAVWWRHRMRFGLDVDDWHVNFTGKLVAPPSQTRPPFWRWNFPMHQILVNMHHITPTKIADVVGFLNREDVSFYSGYPSIIHSLCRLATEANLKLDRKPKVIVTGAENVLDFQRAGIVEWTRATLTDQYGFSEGAGNASQCEKAVYHEDAEFGVLECLNPKDVGSGRTQGEIVCTGFANPDFPLIRYAVGDLAVWRDDGEPCACGRKSKVIERIEGRVDDYIITPEGHQIMRFDYIFKATSNVKESQIVQSRLGEIVVRVVRRDGYVVSDENEIRGEIRKWISPKLEVRFEYLNEIPRATNGKFRAVMSLLPRA